MISLKSSRFLSVWVTIVFHSSFWCFQAEMAQVRARNLPKGWLVSWDSCWDSSSAITYHTKKKKSFREKKKRAMASIKS